MRHLARVLWKVRWVGGREFLKIESAERHASCAGFWAACSGLVCRPTPSGDFAFFNEESRSYLKKKGLHADHLSSNPSLKQSDYTAWRGCHFEKVTKKKDKWMPRKRISTAVHEAAVYGQPLHSLETRLAWGDSNALQQRRPLCLRGHCESQRLLASSVLGRSLQQTQRHSGRRRTLLRLAWPLCV